MTLSEKYEVVPIRSTSVKKWFTQKHYARRIPSIKYCFGLREKETGLLKGVVSFGFPPSPSIAPAIAGEEFVKNVLELNRLILQHNGKNEASYFIANAIKLIPPPHRNN